MTAFILLILALSPDFRVRVDRRSDDHGRYSVVCAGIFERAETWSCFELRKSTRSPFGITMPLMLTGMTTLSPAPERTASPVSSLGLGVGDSFRSGGVS